MSEIERTELFGKLNKVAYSSLESATLFCKMRGNPFVELAHWLHQILELQESDVRLIVRHFELNPSRLSKDMTGFLDKLPRGATSISDLSTHVEDAVERAWVYATLMFSETQIRTGHLLVSMLKTDRLRHILTEISQEFDKIQPDTLTQDFASLLSQSPEKGLPASDGWPGAVAAVGPAAADKEIPPAEMGQGVALSKYSVDLTALAKEGKIDPIVGRDREIRQIVDILMRRRQNNPILTGEAGVGKTAVVEGFALRIAADDVPPPLKGVTVRTLDIGLLQAGAGVRGEFEDRLRKVVEEVKASARPIILFIDEAHMLLGAGGTRGTGDAANLLKPALARGSLRTIAATTTSEYREIEKDAALERRFQEIRVDEPDETNAIRMMRSMASTMEAHHRVQVLDEALEATVRLSRRYIPARQLPDKSVSVLDTACARVAVSQHAIPADVEECRRSIQYLETELRIIANDEAVGVDVQDRRDLASEKLEAEKHRLDDLEQRWESERGLVDRLLDIRRTLRQGLEKVDSPPADAEPAPVVSDQSATQAETRLASRSSGDAEAATTNPVDPELETQSSEPSKEALFKEMRSLQTQLEELQGDKPLILPTVDEDAVASVIGDWTGIPVGRMVRDEIEAVVNLASVLRERVLGQDHALEMIAKRMQTSRARLDDPNRPVGVFMLCGPSGVGKTESALALADAIYGGEQNVITVNMSEFQNKETISTLVGAAPGLIGYEEGGALTEPVRRKPYSVVLLDEFEKAHQDVHELFFNVFDRGRLSDAKGRQIDFRNTVIMLTTNAGDETILNLCSQADPDLIPTPEGLTKALRQPLRDVFPAALLGRVVVIPFYPLSKERLGEIARLQFSRIRERIAAQHKIPFSYDDEVIQLVVERCTELESGARMIRNILTNTVLPQISREMLTRTMKGESLDRIEVTAKDGEFHCKF